MIVAIAAIVASTAYAVVPASPRERPLVVMLLPRAPGRGIIESAIRLNGELVAAGFDVQSTERLLPEDCDQQRMETLARELGAAVAVGLFNDPTGGAVDVWIVDRLTGKTVARHVDQEQGGADQPKLLAIRTAELLRASLLELFIAPEPAGPEPAVAPAPVVHWVSADVDPGHTNRVRSRFSAGGAVLAVPGAGVTPAALLGGGALLDGRWSLQATMVGLGVPLRVTASEGSVDVRQTILTLQAGVRLGGTPIIRPVLTAGAGAYHVSIAGQGIWPYAGSSSARTVFCVSAGIGAVMRLPRRLELALEGQALLAMPHPTVSIAGREVVSAGRPTAVASLVLSGLP